MESLIIKAAPGPVSEGAKTVPADGDCLRNPWPAGLYDRFTDHRRYAVADRIHWKITGHVPASAVRNILHIMFAETGRTGHNFPNLKARGRNFYQNPDRTELLQKFPAKFVITRQFLVAKPK